MLISNLILSCTYTVLQFNPEYFDTSHIILSSFVQEYNTFYNHVIIVSCDDWQIKMQPFSIDTK